MRSFEELTIGETAESKAAEVDRADMIDFAKRYDPQWFHSDPDAARDSVFGEVVASGIYTAALWRRLDHTINGDVDFICGVAWEGVRWPKAVRGGDLLRARSTVIEKRPSTSDASRGVAVYLYEMTNQHGDVVFSCRSVNLVRRRQPGSAGD